MSTNYSIVDLDGYIDVVRKEAASEYSSDQIDDLDNFISINQVRYIIDSYALGFDENNYYIIDSDTHTDIVDEVANWIFNVGLAKLAAANKLECAWDDSTNSMIFWLAENHGENKHDQRTNSSPQIRDGQN